MEGHKPYIQYQPCGPTIMEGHKPYIQYQPCGPTLRLSFMWMVTSKYEILDQKTKNTMSVCDNRYTEIDCYHSVLLNDYNKQPF